MSQNSNQSRIIIGIIIIAIGTMLLLRNLDVFAPFHYLHFVFSWKMILIVIGLILFFNSSNRSSGIILIAIGGFLLIPDIPGVPYFHMWRVGLPVLLMVVGVLILFRNNFDSNRLNSESTRYDMDFIDEIAIFGGTKKNINTKTFKGGKTTSIFGGSELNLLNSNLAEGQNIIDMVAIFGGITFYVPEEWTIKIDVVSVFGGFTDNRSQSRLIVHDPERELVIKGVVIFGGGEIKSL